MFNNHSTPKIVVFLSTNDYWQWIIIGSFVSSFSFFPWFNFRVLNQVNKIFIFNIKLCFLVSFENEVESLCYCKSFVLVQSSHHNSYKYTTTYVLDTYCFILIILLDLLQLLLQGSFAFWLCIYLFALLKSLDEYCKLKVFLLNFIKKIKSGLISIIFKIFCFYFIKH